MKRLIEETFPIKEVSEESAHVKKTYDTDTFLHFISGGRGRPLASSRATAYAALTPATGEHQRVESQTGFYQGALEMGKFSKSPPH